MNRTVINIIRWLIVLAMPFFLGFLTIRLFVAGAETYVTYEYAKEDFPPDLVQYTQFDLERLGLQPLTQAQRRELALVAVAYLQRPEPAEEVIFMLEEQRLPGSGRPLYNSEEISHMIDVKHLTDAIGRLMWIAGGIVVIGLAVLLLREETRFTGFRAIFQGGIATTLTLLFIALFILLAWSIFFVQFHELLFPPGTWTFAYHDSLIRLFPEMFWFDFGVLLSLTALGLGLLTMAIGYVLQRRASRRA